MEGKPIMVFSCIIRKEDDLFVGHCLELDIVATGSTLEEAKKDLNDLIVAQVGYAFSHDNLDNLFRPAPAEVWAAFYKCKTAIEEQLKVKFHPEKAAPHMFIPPWIIAKTCMIGEGCHA